MDSLIRPLTDATEISGSSHILTFASSFFIVHVKTLLLGAAPEEELETFVAKDDWHGTIISSGNNINPTIAYFKRKMEKT